MSQDLINRAEDLLTKRKVRLTKARRTVIKHLLGAPGPASADDIHAHLKEIPLSSLYRTLSVLADTGVLTVYRDSGGVGRFEPAEWLTGHHHHLVCTECGDTRDLDPNPGIEKQMGAILESLGREAGYQITGHRIDLEGVCPSCEQSPLKDRSGRD